jgi:hypothetical protein
MQRNAVLHLGFKFRELRPLVDNCGFKSANDVLHLIICGFKSRNDVLYTIAALNPGLPPNLW